MQNKIKRNATRIYLETKWHMHHVLFWIFLLCFHFFVHVKEGVDSRSYASMALFFLAFQQVQQAQNKRFDINVLTMLTMLLLNMQRTMLYRMRSFERNQRATNIWFKESVCQFFPIRMHFHDYYYDHISNERVLCLFFALYFASITAFSILLRFSFLTHRWYS